MQDKQKIVVSASTDKDSEGMYELKVVAGGVSRTPYAFTKKQIQDYEALPQADSHFKSAQLDPKTQILKLHIATMGYHARMSLKLRTIEKDNNFQIHWESVEGHFVGMKGVVELVELERQKTEISMTAKYRASKLPLPRVLMGAGLEVVGRLSAYKLRSFIQHKYRN